MRRQQQFWDKSIMGFQRVKEILDQAVAAWALGHQHSADLTGHGPSFSWKTKADLLAAVGHGRQLIQPEVIGNGRGSQANLVLVLKVGLPWANAKGRAVCAGWPDTGNRAVD
jgi:hypothetical protein